MKAAQALALFDGLEFVTPDQIQEVAVPVMAHRLALDAHAALRALLATEQTIVEAAGGTLAMQELDMWQPYSHVGLSFAFAEHAALDSTYKVGYQPPTFRRVNVVQTGIAFRF